jgi:hypothetical protein
MYRHGLDPDVFWGWGAVALIHRIPERVPGHIRDEVTRAGGLAN